MLTIALSAHHFNYWFPEKCWGLLPSLLSSGSFFILYEPWHRKAVITALITVKLTEQLVLALAALFFLSGSQWEMKCIVGRRWRRKVKWTLAVSDWSRKRFQKPVPASEWGWCTAYTNAPPGSVENQAGRQAKTQDAHSKNLIWLKCTEALFSSTWKLVLLQIPEGM